MTLFYRDNTRLARRCLAPAVGAAVLLVPALSWSQGSDPVAARAHLRQGYALKQQGKCKDAVQHLQESARLERQPKTLINLGECEQKLGQLALAQSHFLEARDLARSNNDATLRGIAQKRLDDVEKRMPKLGIELGKDAPAGTVVTRDGLEVGAISLRTPLPIDVGRHVVIARGGGFERQYEITLGEGESKQLEVTPIGGKALPAAAKVADKPNDETKTAATNGESKKSSSSAFKIEGPEGDRLEGTGTTQRTIGYITIGAGVVGLGAGAFFGVRTLGHIDQLSKLCTDAAPCNDGFAEYDATKKKAENTQLYSAVGLGIGGAAAVTGLILVLTAPKSTSTASWHVAPLVGRDATGVFVDGRF